MPKRKRDNPTPVRPTLYEFDSRVEKKEGLHKLEQMMCPLIREISDNVSRYGIHQGATHGKGIGKFCTESIEEGELIGVYTGTVYNAGDTPPDINGRHMVLPNSLVVDGFGPSTINGADCNHSCQKHNCRYMFVHDDPACINGVVVATSRRIHAGEELLVDYGDAYFMRSGLVPCLCENPCPMNRFFA